VPGTAVVRRPVPGLMVATAVLPLLHVPPETALLSEVVIPEQRPVAPVMGAVAFTVTGLVTKQPPSE
jgi:hypothetical protein